MSGVWESGTWHNVAAWELVAMLAARPQADPMGDKLTTHRPERTY